MWRQQPRRRGQTWRWLRRLGSPCPGFGRRARRGAAAKGAGARALPTRRSAEATSAPHLYVTGSASARSIHSPGLRRAASRRRPCPAPDAIPPTDRRACPSEPAPLERCHTWRSQVYSTENAPEPRRVETAREEHALGPRPPLRLAKAPARSTDHLRAGGEGCVVRQL